MAAALAAASHAEPVHARRASGGRTRRGGTLGRRRDDAQRRLGRRRRASGAPPEPFSWGAARAPDAASNRVERGARDGRKMKASATRYRAMTNAGARRRAGEVRRHFGDARGVPNPPSRPRRTRTRRTSARLIHPPRGDTFSARRARSSPRRTRRTTTSFLPRTRKDMGGRGGGGEASERRRRGTLRSFSARGASLRCGRRRPTSRQAHVRARPPHELPETERRPRVRSPDEIDELVLDVDRAEIEEEKRRAAFETRRRASDRQKKSAAPPTAAPGRTTAGRLRERCDDDPRRGPARRRCGAARPSGRGT